MNKPLRILAGRAQLLGDQVSALAIPVYFRKLYPDAHIIWPVAKKCSQGAMLWLNHPAISEIFVFDGQEGPQSERDWNMINSCSIVIPYNPSHPDNRYPQEFSIYSESWRMAGLPLEEFYKMTEEERRPKLYKWFNPEPRILDKKNVALWGFASYGNREQKRNPTKEWYDKLVRILIDNNIEVLQFGHPKDPLFVDHPYIGLHRFNHLDFFTQIKMTLSTDLFLGTDSGSSLIIGAYEFKSIVCLTDHWGNTNNPYALAPDNPNNFNFFAPGGCDNISIDSVVDKIKEKLNLTS